MWKTHIFYWKQPKNHSVSYTLVQCRIKYFFNFFFIDHYSHYISAHLTYQKNAVYMMQSSPIFIVLLATYPSAAELLFTVCCIYSHASQNNIAQEGKFEVLMAVTIKVAVFCEVRLCNPLDIHRHFEWTRCLHCTSNKNISKLLPYYTASHPSRWLLWVSWDVSKVKNSLYLTCCVLI